MSHVTNAEAENVTVDAVRIDAIEAAYHHTVMYRRPSAGWLCMRGTDRLDLLQRLTTNDVVSLRPGTGKHTVLLTDKARIIDVLAVLHDEQETMLLCSDVNAARVRQWLRNYVIMDDVQVSDHSAEVMAIDWMGPQAPQAIAALLQIDVATLPLCGWVDHTIDGAACRTMRIPSVCELSYRTIMPVGTPLPFDEGAITVLNDAEADYLRVMGGMGRLGAEWTEAYNPLEAGLLHMVSFAKGCYIGQEVVARLDTYNKVKQRIVGVTSGQPLTIGGAVIIEGADVGRITSVIRGARTPLYYGLAYVRHEHALPDTDIIVRTDAAEHAATIVALPMQES